MQMAIPSRALAVLVALLLPVAANAAWRTDAPRSYETTIGRPTAIPSRGGGLFLAGYETVVRIANPGGTLVRESLPPPGVSRLTGMVMLADGGFVAAGYGEGGQAALLLRTNPDGSLLWLRHFGGAGYDPTYAPSELQFTASESLDRVLIGVPGSPASVIALDLDGRVAWMRSDATLDLAMQALALQGTRLVVGGSRGCGQASVVALDAVDGAVDWVSHPTLAAPACIGSLLDASVVANGVIVAYSVATSSSLGAGFGALRLDAATGVQGWTYRDALANSRAVAMVAAGSRVAVAGSYSEDSSVVTFLDAATGQVVTRTPKIGLVADVAEQSGAVYVVGNERRQTAPVRVGTLERYAGDGVRTWAASYAGALVPSQTSMPAIGFGNASDDPIVLVQGNVGGSFVYRAATYAAADGSLLAEAAETSAVDAPVRAVDLGDGTIAEIRQTQDASGPAFVVRRIRRDDQLLLWTSRIPRTYFGGANVLPIGSDLLFWSETQSTEQRFGNTSIVTDNFAVRRLDGSTGSILWSRSFFSDVPWSYGVYPGQHLVVGADGAVYWTIVNSLFDSTPRTFDYSMQVRRLDPASGSSTWLRTLYSGEWQYVPSAPWLHAVPGGVVVASTARPVPGDRGSALELLDAASGVSSWLRPMADTVYFPTPGVAQGGDVLVGYLDLADDSYRTIAERFDSANGVARWSRGVATLDGTTLGVGDVAVAGDAFALVSSRYTGSDYLSEATVLDAATGATRQSHRLDFGVGQGSGAWLLPSANEFDVLVSEFTQSGVARLRPDGSLIGYHALMVDFPQDGSTHDEQLYASAVGADSSVLFQSISRPRRSHVEVTKPLYLDAGDLRTTLRLTSVSPDRGGTGISFVAEVLRVDASAADAVNLQVGANPAGVVEIASCVIDGVVPCAPQDALGTVRLRTTLASGQRITIFGSVLAPNNLPSTEVLAVSTFDYQRPEATLADNAARELARVQLHRDGFE